MGKQKTHNQFIKECNEKYNNKYTYISKYKNNKCILEFICPIHGKISQRADSHLNSIFGCKYCSYDFKKITYDEFIFKSNIIHNNKYQYQYNDLYFNSNKETIIICPIHGEFKQLPHNHLSGRGCKKCKNEKIGNLKRKKLDILINDFKLKHNNKYIYNKDIIDYINNKTPIIIKCPIHGEFKQRPDDHLNGHGCKECNESFGEKNIKKILLYYNIKFEIEKTFTKCKYKRKLPFDFYLSDYNICIEYDGIQHFEKINYFGGEDTLKTQKIK